MSTPPELILPRGTRQPIPGRSHELCVFVTPDVLFPGVEASEAKLAELLSTLSRNAVLLACAQLNALVSGMGPPEPKARQERVIAMTCAAGDVERINALAMKHPGSGAPTVFFCGQLRELMRWAVRYCPDIPDDGAITNSPSARRQFLHAALIASTLWGQQVFGGRLKSTGDIDSDRQRALGAFRRGLEGSGTAPFVGTALGRGWLFFSEYFPRRYPDLASEFLSATGLTVEQYFTCVAGLIAQYLSPDRVPAFNSRTVAAATAYRDVFPAYLGLESQPPDRLADGLWDDFSAHGYRALRERPIVVLDDGLAIILDPTFYFEKLMVGPLFYLAAQARGDRKKSNSVFSAFGEAFEDYAGDILRKMYPRGAGLASRLQAPLEGTARGANFEMDAVLNDFYEVVVFEMKAVWLRDDMVLRDFEEWLEHLRSLYGAVAPGDVPKRPKGVAQLARHARRILEGNCGSQQSDFTDARVVHPVLVVHDARLNTPAYGNFLDGEFRRLLGEVPKGKRVNMLTIMTIDDLENLASSVGEFTLRALLADYAEKCPDAMRSLHNFMATSPVYAGKIRPSKQVRESSERLLQHAHRELFPDATQRPEISGVSG